MMNISLQNPFKAITKWQQSHATVAMDPFSALPDIEVSNPVELRKKSWTVALRIIDK